MLKIVALAAFAVSLTGSASALAQGVSDGRIGGGLECVPFARETSGIQIFGNAGTWWHEAAGRYAEGKTPEIGAVLVFRPTGAIKLGHVAVVSRVVSPRILMITHANWSRIGGLRGQIERDVTLVDASAANDWSTVRVWWRDAQGLGRSSYPVYGFIYGRAVGTDVRIARPSRALSGISPDIVGAVIDSLP